MEAHTGGLLPYIGVATDQMGKPKQDLGLWSCYFAGLTEGVRVPAPKQYRAERKDSSPDLPSSPLCSQGDHPCVNKARSLQEVSRDAIPSTHPTHLDVPF